MISERQEAFLRDLIAQVYGSDDPAAAATLLDRLPRMTGADASEHIDVLLTLRKSKHARARVPEVHAGPVVDMPEPGYYAVVYGGVLRFYAVREGKGKWSGRRFLHRFRSDYEDRIPAAERTASVTAILSDPYAAQMRFARETVHCYRCGRRLTDETSRRIGVGPDCAEMLGIVHGREEPPNDELVLLDM